MCSPMASKNISIRQDVYDHLKDLQRDNESFSEEIIRLVGEYRNDFSDIIGLEISIDWTDVQKDREKSMEDGRREEILT